MHSYNFIMTPSFTSSPAAIAQSNRWETRPDELARALDAYVLVERSDMSVIAFEGSDAIPFLHAQTTADVMSQGETDWLLGGYCTPKGRLLAVFDLWRSEQDAYMVLPREIASAVARRLSMFVLRSKVRVRDAGSEWTVLGIVGPAGSSALVRAGWSVPPAAGQCSAQGAARLARVAGGRQAHARFVLAVPAAEKENWLGRLGSATGTGAGSWWWSQIDAAVPAVFAPTQELFVPQALNLEVLGGVSFRKGCYPGQEIVARSQYLGKLRRRMGLAHADGIGSGADLFHDASREPIGRIVMASSAPGGGWDLLYECPVERATQGRLHAGDAGAPPLQLRDLPYELFDPTA
jgi:tRNA-modifying protein YgfZ